MIGNGTPRPDRSSNFGLVSYSYNVEVPVDFIRTKLKEQLRGFTGGWNVTVTPPTHVPRPDNPEHSAAGELIITHPTFDEDACVRLTSQQHKDGETPTEYYTTYGVHREGKEELTLLSEERNFKLALDLALTTADAELTMQKSNRTPIQSIIHRLKYRV